MAICCWYAMKTNIPCVQGLQGISRKESGSALLKFIEQDNKQVTSSFFLLIFCAILRKCLYEGIFEGPFCREIFMFSESSEENRTELIGLLGGERNGICEFENINVKMEFSAFCTTMGGPYFKWTWYMKVQAIKSYLLYLGVHYRISLDLSIGFLSWQKNRCFLSFYPKKIVTTCFVRNNISPKFFRWERYVQGIILWSIGLIWLCERKGIKQDNYHRIQTQEVWGFWF